MAEVEGYSDDLWQRMPALESAGYEQAFRLRVRGLHGVSFYLLVCTWYSTLAMEEQSLSLAWL